MGSHEIERTNASFPLAFAKTIYHTCCAAALGGGACSEMVSGKLQSCYRTCVDGEGREQKAKQELRANLTGLEASHNRSQ